ncbi:MAG: arsenic efflux protein [Bacteroidales bacterium]|nr:arsenic efflux protein [Bacteroidales bacterium]
MIHIFEDVLRNAILVTGLVIIMMLMIEYVNVVSQGHFFSKLKSSRVGGVLFGAFMGIMPGCIGGFATVSLYSHKMLSFGALLAMMIASSGDEAFVMLAMIPRQAIILFVILFVLAVAVGLLADLFPSRKTRTTTCGGSYDVHESDIHHHHHGEHCNEHCPHRSIKNLFKPEWRRWAILAAVTAFIIALAFGMLEHEHEQESGHLQIFDEYWLNIVFAVLSLFVLWFTATADSHFVNEHLWNHIIKGHTLSLFLWTFGALLLIELGLHYFNIETWAKDNIPWMILLAVLVGLIPESGPHMLFVTLFASGMVPFSVLLASSISQDGHSSLPLLAETKKGFLTAKIINAVVAIVVAYAFYFFGL